MKCTLGQLLVLLMLFAALGRAQTALVSTGAVWKYLDDGSNQNIAWRFPGFNDSGWASGPAQLGYGDGDEATPINIGPPTNVFVTTYFRHVFTGPDPASISSLVLRILRDDGAVAYLNGTEVFRNNMPTGSVDHLTLATSIVDGPQESQFYAARPNPALLQVGPNVLAVEIHQGNATSGDVSFDAELLANVPPSRPEVVISEPANNSDFTAPVDIPVSISATDFDGVVQRVELRINGNSIGLDTIEPYSFISSNQPIGMHALRAVALDDSGLVTTSAPVNIRVLAPPVTLKITTNGSWWRYLDNSAPAPAGWNTVGFNDAGWNSGPTQLGYGEGDEATPISFVTGGVPITFYFRHAFVITNTDAFTNMLFEVLRDDGVVVYLNGREAFRMNMPTTDITHSTLALTPVGGTNENFYFPTNISANLLVTGTNLLAAQLHQNTEISNDGSFDLLLTATGPPTGQPRLTIEYGGGVVVIRWNTPGFVLEQRFLPSGSWTAIPDATSPYQVPFPTGSRLFRLSRSQP
ncbi:MAG: Ig-like domain-containing protein [Verrucomicrobia subdivision 3 bacterium]|nr:Ig-like domain-containing protein [Limisphaerales bacterium]